MTSIFVYVSVFVYTCIVLLLEIYFNIFYVGLRFLGIYKPLSSNRRVKLKQQTYVVTRFALSVIHPSNHPPTPKPTPTPTHTHTHTHTHTLSYTFPRTSWRGRRQWSLGKQANLHGRVTIPSDSIGSGPIHRSHLCSDKLLDKLPGVTTLYENFLHGLKISGKKRCLGYRDKTVRSHSTCTSLLLYRCGLVWSMLPA